MVIPIASNAFNDYFSDPYERNEDGKLARDKNFLIEFCSFGPSNQNAISCSRTNNKVVVDSCFFHDFSAKSIDFFYAGEFVQRHVCSLNSPVVGSGLHSQVWLDSGEYKNFVIESSISTCGNLGQGNSPLYFNDGIMINTYNNISSCQTYDRCGFYMQNSFNRTTTKFCTIHGNMATSTKCVYPYSNDFLLSSTNIINNSVSDRLICSVSNGIIESCVILNNSGNNTFYCTSSPGITVIHCFCNQTERIGNVNISFIDTKPFINNVKHFSSYLCQATMLNLYLKDEIISKNIKNFFRFFRYHPIINYTQLLC